MGYLEDGALRTEAVHRFVTPIVEDGERLVWDLEALWSELAAGLEAARAVAPRLRSLSVDSWGVDYVRVDRVGRPVGRSYCYRDPRTTGVMEAVLDRLPAKRIYEATGIQFMPINTLYQVVAELRDEPELAAPTTQRLPIADYFNFRFSGRPVSEISLASTTQLMRVGVPRWATELLDPLSIPASGWPDIVPSGSLLGEADGIHVVATCSHDTGCAVAATPGAPEQAWAYISCGTWSLLGVEVTTPIVTERARRAGFTNEAGLDGTIRFLKNLTGLWALQECVREWRLEGPDVYDVLLEEAEHAGPAVGVIDLEDPRFLNRGDMEERIRAACVERGLALPGNRGALTRLILESIADSYRRTIPALEELTGRPVEVIHLVGGGSQNELLCRLTARACRRPVVAGPVEATAFGNLLIQMRTLGDLPAGLTIRDVVRASAPLKSYRPEAL